MGRLEIGVGGLRDEVVPDPDLDGCHGVDGGFDDDGKGDELREARVIS